MARGKELSVEDFKNLDEVGPEDEISLDSNELLVALTINAGKKLLVSSDAPGIKWVHLSDDLCASIVLLNGREILIGDQQGYSAIIQPTNGNYDTVKDLIKSTCEKTSIPVESDEDEDEDNDDVAPGVRTSRAMFAVSQPVVRSAGGRWIRANSAEVHIRLNGRNKRSDFHTTWQAEDGMIILEHRLNVVHGSGPYHYEVHKTATGGSYMAKTEIQKFYDDLIKFAGEKKAEKIKAELNRQKKIIEKRYLRLQSSHSTLMIQGFCGTKNRLFGPGNWLHIEAEVKIARAGVPQKGEEPQTFAGRTFEQMKARITKAVKQ